MSEFEKELEKFNLENGTDYRTLNQYSDVLTTHFKDWKPPKELVEVPQIVADFIKTLKIRGVKPLMDSVTFGEIDFTEEKRDETLHWINEHQEEYMRAWLDGYTVEKPKEKLYFVKFPGMRADLAYLCKSCSPGELGYLEKYSSKEPNKNSFCSRYDKKYYGGWQRQFTEPEVKAIDERFWAFAVPVEDEEMK